jgi:tRNA-specific 2-thiouridylase
MRTVVAMSGGVDSSVAAALLKEQGHEVVGVHLKLHGSDARPEPGHCCGLDDALDARRVADRLGIPFYVLDLQEIFHRDVIQPYVQSWLRGETPSPCVSCNGVLKFDVLWKKARALGADALATGHYARTRDGRLFMAKDRAKDQSYFLHPVRPDVLPHVLFPLGELSKPEVRDLARSLDLLTADKPESMEVCFVPGDDHAAFVSSSTTVDATGEIVDEFGTVLGRHAGYWRYTIGQRRGLGLAGGPWFVLAIDADRRRVVVGPESRLQAQRVLVRGLRWLRPSVAPLHARFRHRGALVPCTVEMGDALSLQAPARAATPGQSVVLYDEDEVVAGGTIARAVA